MDQIIVRLEFTDADPAHPDPAERSAMADTVVADLRAGGIELQPAYTGAQGGDVYEVLSHLAEGAAANKDVVLALIAGVAAPIASALAGRLKKSEAPKEKETSPTIIIVGDVQIPHDGQPLDPDELLRQLLDADPDLPQRITPKTPIIVRGHVPAVPPRRRR